MLPIVPESTIPESPRPPGEGRTVDVIDVERDQPHGLGPDETPPSALESRTPAMPHVSYSRDQSLGQVWHNDTGHVRVGRFRPDAVPDSEHEPSIYPQRPTFRAPPESWYEDVVDRD